MADKSAGQIKKPTYPATPKIDQVDTYHGIQVADPYRWLEDEASAERTRWIAAQKTVTEDFLFQIPTRCNLRRRFEELLNYHRHYDFVRRGGWLCFKMNKGLQQQLAVYVQRTLTDDPEVLIDPTEFTSDGTTRITGVIPSWDGKYLAYGLSRGGSDWQEYVVKDMTTRKDLPETVRWVKLAPIAWWGDGFYYSRYPPPANMGKVLSERNENHQVWYHRVGTPQSADTLIFEDQVHPSRLCFVETTEDARFVVLTVRDYGSGHPGNALWLLQRERGRSTGLAPVVTSFDDEFRVLDNQDDHLLLLTNRNAPNWRLVLIDPANPGEENWREVIAESHNRLENVTPIGDRLFGTYRKDGAHEVYVFDRTGRAEHQIALPGIGIVQVFPGQKRDTDALWAFSSFTDAPTIYRYNIQARTSSVFRQPRAQCDAADYETTRVFCASKDGTRFPMFVVHRKGLTLDGSHPSLLYGYGGNGASVGPQFDPLLIALLERGVVYAVACLRGGGEYGEAWHRAGMRDKKQNVFDDCVAAGIWLQRHGYTSPDRSALTGSSNGGLLVGAVMTQRPDLFKVALPDVGVMDMLRFHQFTIGQAWIAEYGSSDDPGMFPVLLAYSPLHSIREGVSYPATLVTTSEHDDRVVPAHSFKFVAMLQAKGAGPNPYLIRIDQQSGHGPVSLAKALDERADVYAFLLGHMPPGPTGQVRARGGSDRFRLPASRQSSVL